MNASHVLVIVIIFTVLFYYLVGYNGKEKKIKEDVDVAINFEGFKKTVKILTNNSLLPPPIKNMNNHFII